MLGIFAVIGALFVVYVVAKAGAGAGTSQLPPPSSPPKRPYAEGRCDECKYDGRVYALQAVPGVRLCINCSHLALRLRGLDEGESVNLPHGSVNGICRKCDKSKPVSIVNRSWICAECAGKLKPASSVTTIIAICPGCAFNGPLFAEQPGEVARCVNCAYLHVRHTGGAPEWDHLPAGHVIGECRRCSANKVVVSLLDGKTWTCLDCEATKLVAETNDMLRQIVKDE